MNDGPHNPELPARNRPVHQPVFELHDRAIIVFLTVCTKDRRQILTTEEMLKILRSSWRSAGHWLVGRYVIMPDHIHLFCAPGLYPVHPLASWVRYWKTSASKLLKANAGTFWQPDFWDTQLRSHESYDAKWNYVCNNPVRAGLVARVQDWPYQGELNSLRWHN